MEIMKNGTLRFWGDWFGRPMDNYHIVKKVDYNEVEQILVICFEEDERCMILDPENIVNKEGRFCVSKASKIIWEWYSDGKKHESSDLHKRIYIYRDEKVVYREYYGESEVGSKSLNPQRQLAFEIC